MNYWPSMDCACVELKMSPGCCVTVNPADPYARRGRLADTTLIFHNRVDRWQLAWDPGASAQQRTP